MADVERDRHETVEQEEVVEELHHEIAGKVAVPSQDLAATKTRKIDAGKQNGTVIGSGHEIEKNNDSLSFTFPHPPEDIIKN